MQKVYLSATRSGQLGLFTSGFLAWPFHYKHEFDLFEKDRKAYCERRGFEYVEKNYEYVPYLRALW